MNADNKTTLPQVIADLAAQESNAELLKSITPAPPSTIDVNAGQYPAVDPMAKPLWEIDADILNPFEELPPVPTWATIQGSPTLPKQGIVSVSAKPKQGKSTGVYALMCALLTGQPFGTIEPLDTPRLVMVFDFEMGRNSLVKRLKGVAATLGDRLNRFVVVPMGRVAKKDYITFVEAKINAYQPDIIVLDTVTRLTQDFNDNTESYALMENWVYKKLAQEHTVIVLIHENKAKEDTNMTGHLGSSVAQWQSEAYKVKKEQGVFCMTVEQARDWETSEERFTFALDTDGRFIDGSAKEEERQEQQRAELRQEISDLIADAEEIARQDLIKRYMEEHQCGKTTAEGKVREAVKWCIIFPEKRNGKVYYSMPI